MQAALQDGLAQGQYTTASFRICQRMLHRCHEIIFSDHPTPSASPYGSMKVTLSYILPRKKIRHHLEPTTVGIAMVLASIAHPAVAQVMGETAVEQGRADEEGSTTLRSIESEDAATPVVTPSQSRTSLQDDDDDDDDDISPQTAVPGRSYSFEQSMIAASQTVPALPLHLQGIRRSRASEDPLGQMDRELPSTPSHSTPSLQYTSRPSSRPGTFNLADTLLQRYDSQSQSHLLRNNYCRSEVWQFFLLFCHSIFLKW